MKRPPLGVALAIGAAIVALVSIIVYFATRKKPSTPTTKQCSTNTDCKTNQTCKDGACIDLPPFFFAEGATSCDAACAAKGSSCDASRISGLNTYELCAAKVTELGGTFSSGGTYQDDNSGCTYYPSAGLVQQFIKDGPPGCGVVNPDTDRQRVCACN